MKSEGWIVLLILFVAFLFSLAGFVVGYEASDKDRCESKGYTLIEGECFTGVKKVVL